MAPASRHASKRPNCDESAHLSANSTRYARIWYARPMRTAIFVCLTIALAGCTSGEKPPEVPGDGSTTSASSTNGANAVPTATTAAPTTTANAPETDPPPTGSCGGRTCAPGETCASYYGIAGPRGPLFHECVIRCRRGEPNDGCPAGTICYTVADGPGDVCR